MSVAIKTEIDSAYQAAYESSVWYRTPNPGYLRVSGESQVDYLQRQTTNDLGLLRATRVVGSLLTSASGRILEVFTLAEDGEAIGMLTQAGHATGLADYFKRHIFFNDHVTIENLSDQFAQFEIHGPQASATLNGLGFNQVPQLNELTQIDFDGEPLRAIGIKGYTVPLAFKLLVPQSSVSPLLSLFAKIEFPQVDASTMETLRIEAGLAGDPEFTDTYTPFEVGLEEYVSADKGCYTGQEVLARQVTYDKVVRKLVRIKASVPISKGDQIQDNGKPIGKITSAAVSPKQGVIALGVVRKPFYAPGAKVEIASKQGLVYGEIA